MRKRWIAWMLVVFLLQAACSAEPVDNIADRCRFWVSEKSAEEVYDASMGSAWKPSGKDAELRILLPEEGAAWIQINWTIPPEDYTLTEYDADKNQISTHTAADDSFPCIAQLLPLDVRSKYLSLRFAQPGQGINKIRIFPEGELPETVVQWQAPHEKCDLMVVSTHQDDEWLWFGGIIPYYDLVQGKDVQVVYMANCGRLRYAEALNGLAVSGVRTYPAFVGLKDKRDASLKEAIRTWKSADFIVSVLVGIIRRFRPEVILTHDWDGEYGHPQHKITSRAMEYAIEAAADPDQYPDSAGEYGAWQVKKLYRHLETKDQIEFDWHVAYPEFGGRTGIEVATDSMNQHQSQLKTYQVEDHGKYDNALFGLSYSTVGNDLKHEDLFENIPEPTPEPSPVPTAEPSPVPTAEPSPAPTVELSPKPTEKATLAPTPNPTPMPTPVRERGKNMAPFAVVFAATIACGVGLFGIRTRTRRRRHRRRGHKGR